MWREAPEGRHTVTDGGRPSRLIMHELLSRKRIVTSSCTKPLCRPSGAFSLFDRRTSGLRHWLNYVAAPRLADTVSGTASRKSSFRSQLISNL